MPPIYYFLLGSAFVFGACIGSFLNVCIYRLPEGLSVVSPRSRCPQCGHQILWYENIPILSYFLLRGHCSQCGVSFSLRYLLVEALTGGLFLSVLYHFGFTWGTPVYMLFVSGLVAITFIDLDHQIIPDVISLPGIILGFAASFLLPWVDWIDSLLGILLGGGLLFAIAFGYEFLTKKEGMGGGDIKLLAMIGAFLGWQAVFPIIFIASLAGTLIGVPLMLFSRSDGKYVLPFGPFLSFSALVWLFFGPDLLTFYFDLFGLN
ncbi:prepilin peptidase [Geothermobacter hydrogeniphilus]|uniref:Prepilin leader peptidase/N-methyltransferase n=1 Tax=Geothermobacter hydrogeniphilus TaxID=1969733 RepID=A0A2K2H6M7_9BACT|nr:A24 family peptidase [Geothermobacter hydrogeniphilus]PNU18901.1 prepilin peptidase [Geothermobacter hydrogeniphilus]